MLWTACISLLALHPASSAKADDQAPVVRAGCEYDYPPFCTVTDDGKADGFSVELMRAALKTLGRKARFTVGSWPTVRQALEENRLDALPLVGRTPERETVFDFTVPYLTTHGVIVVRDDTNDIHDLDDLRGKRIAVLKGDNAEEFVRRHNLGATVTTTETFTVALRQLSEGKHDAVVIQEMVARHLIRENGFDNLRLAGRPLPEFAQRFCFAVHEDNKELLADLNEGLSRVIANGTYQQLHRKWFPAVPAGTRSRIVVGGDHDYPPYEYLDENGQPAGYNVELTRAIARKIGVDVHIHLGPWAEIRKGLESGEIDLVHGMFYSRQRDTVFDFSPPHTVVHHVAVTRRGDPPPQNATDLKGKRLVVMRGDIMHDFALEHGLVDRLSAVETQEEALRQLAEGRHDCALVARLPAQYWIRQHGWDNLDVADAPLVSPEYCFAVLPKNRLLLSRFSEGLATLQQTGDYREIHEKWLGAYTEPEATFWDVLRYVLIAVIPVLLALVAAVLWSRSLRGQVALRTEELRRQRDLSARIIDDGPLAVVIMDTGGTIMSANAPAEEILRLTHDDVVEGRTYNDPTWRIVDSAGNAIADEDLPFRQIMTTGKAVHNLQHAIQSADGSLRHLSISGAPLTDARGTIERVVFALEDITERERRKAYHQLGNRILQTLNQAGEFQDLLRTILLDIRDTSGADAVAIRLQEGDEFPYVLQEGFSDEFVRDETSLVERDRDGGVCLNEDGTISLECTCGLVLSGQTDPDNPLFTAGGSCWTNNAFTLLDLPAQDDPRHHPRNECIHQGFASVALIPIRTENRIVGLLQLNGRKTGLFSLGLVQALESIATHIGEAMLRKQAQEALAESEARFRGIFESTMEGVVLHELITDRRGNAVNYRILEANPAFERIMGIPLERADGALATDLYGTDKPPYLEVYERVVKTGEPQRFEVNYAPSNQCFSISACLLSGQRFATVFEDITQRKKAENDLRHAQALLQAAMDNSPAGIAIADAPSGRLRYVNDAGLMIREGSRDEIVNGVGIDQYVASWNLLDLDGTPLPTDEVPLARALRYGESCSREFIIRRPEGEDRTVLARAAPIKNDEGEIEAAIVVFLDITERKQAEEARRKTEMLLDETGRMAKIGGWELDARTQEVTWTRETYRIHELPFEKKPPLDEALSFWHPEDRPTLVEAIRRALDHGEPYDLELRFITATGKNLVARTRCVPVVADGSVVKLRGTFQDITEQNDMQERLRQMEKMDAIGQLAGGVAHDFNNQLAGIMGFADLLRQRLDEADLKTYADNVLVAARRAGDLTKKLLAFARKGRYQSVPVEVHDILHEVAEFMYHSIDKRVRIKQVLAARPSTTMGDPGQLQNAILNLALNAADAMPDGGELIMDTAIVELDADYCAGLPYTIEPGPYLRVAITDTGTGISREHLDHIFEPFFTTKEVGKGTGMGLAAVYGTVKQHGGAIQVYSEVDHGTTFKVFLPIADDVVERVERDTSVVAASREATILVVDDEEILRDMAREMLQSIGYTVDTAENGEAAMAHFKAQRQQVDLVVLDMVMPHMNGPETYRAMKAIDPDVKVLLASGYSINGAAQDLLDQGVQGFIQKPFELAQLSAKVAAVLRTVH